MHTIKELPLWQIMERGKAAKAEAMQRVEMNADMQWKDMVTDKIREAARELPRFTTDQIWFLIEKESASTHEPRAIGALMRTAAIEGFIKPTSQYTPSLRPECHRRPVMIWESLIYKKL